LDLLSSFLGSLAILYAQQRPITLSRQGITAAAGTFLARDSNRCNLILLTCGQTLQLS